MIPTFDPALARYVARSSSSASSSRATASCRSLARARRSAARTSAATPPSPTRSRTSPRCRTSASRARSSRRSRRRAFRAPIRRSCRSPRHRRARGWCVLQRLPQRRRGRRPAPLGRAASRSIWSPSTVRRSGPFGVVTSRQVRCRRPVARSGSVLDQVRLARLGIAHPGVACGPPSGWRADDAERGAETAAVAGARSRWRRRRSTMPSSVVDVARVDAVLGVVGLFAGRDAAHRRGDLAVVSAWRDSSAYCEMAMPESTPIRTIDDQHFDEGETTMVTHGRDTQQPKCHAPSRATVAIMTPARGRACRVLRPPLSSGAPWRVDCQARSRRRAGAPLAALRDARSVSQPLRDVEPLRRGARADLGEGLDQLHRRSRSPDPRSSPSCARSAAGRAWRRPRARAA